MDQVRVGVIGAGKMGQRHCRIYSNLRRAHLVGICDAQPAVGCQVAQQYDVPYYEHIEALLPHVDAVSLVTPTPFHFELAMRCLAHGIHVLIEKPITETLEQAEILVNTAEASGLVVQVGHIERFNPTFIELKNVLGHMTPLAVNLRRLSPYEGSNTDVDVVLDLMVHDLDLVLDLMGQDPYSVEAYGLTAFSGSIDHVIAHLGFEARPLLTVTASRVIEQKIRSIEIAAMEAYLEADLLDKKILVHRRTKGEYLNNNKYHQESVVERIHVPIIEPLFAELQSFVECILAGKKPLVSARDGLRVLRLAHTIRSAVYAHLIDANLLQQHRPAQTSAPYIGK